MKADLLRSLAYAPLDPQDERFRRILWATVVLYMLLGMGVGLLKVPPPALPDVTQLPPRIAKLIIPPKAPPMPEVKPAPKPEKAKPAETEPKKTEVAAKPEPSPEEIAERQRRRNLEIAMNSGLLKILKQSDKQPVSDTKLKKAFSEIKGLSSRPELSKPGLALKEPAHSGGIDDMVSQLEKALKDSKVIISDKALRQSGGISPAGAEKGIEGPALTDRKTTGVENPFQIKGYEEGKSPRTYDSIAEVVEGYKTGIIFIYNKALRTNPTLRGTITVEFTIAASGEIIDCRIVSTSMTDPPFEESLVKRIFQWRFPAIPEGDVTVVYPIVFYVTG
ncbi:MAG TPA: TonB family protein [Nitrospiria bacterium]|nr:TonB family protein [Nitrospiria bacterium]